MRAMALFVPILLYAHLVSAKDRSQEVFAGQVKAKFANKAERVVPTPC